MSEKAGPSGKTPNDGTSNAGSGPVSSGAKNAPKPAGMSVDKLLKMLAESAALSKEETVKTMEEYKFWKTQPVVPFDQKIEAEGPIETKAVEEVPKEPYALRGDFEWSTIDIDNPAQLTELYDLLYNNYIEDDDETFRFKYSPEFLQWAMRSPGWHPDWSVGVRVKDSKKLVAFISGIPSKLKAHGKPVNAAEVNFMCVHKKLRSKRLAPLLIREVTRRINLTGVWQALHTGGTVLPSPVSTCRYFHRSLDWPKLYDVGFSPLPIGSTPAKQVARYSLPGKPTLPNIRPMTTADVDQVAVLLEKYLTRFELNPDFSREEVEHWLVNAGKDGKPKVVKSFVVESAEGKVTDFVSYYVLESTVLGNSKYDSIKVAYAFYYATDAAFGIGEHDDQKPIKTRLTTLFQNALIFAKEEGCDVFNALSLQDNPLFLEDLKFGPGDGYLRYYLFNYKVFPVFGGLDPENQAEHRPGTGVGVVML